VSVRGSLLREFPNKRIFEKAVGGSNALDQNAPSFFHADGDLPGIGVRFSGRGEGELALGFAGGEYFDVGGAFSGTASRTVPGVTANGDQYDVGAVGAATDDGALAAVVLRGETSCRGRVERIGVRGS